MYLNFIGVSVAMNKQTKHSTFKSVISDFAYSCPHTLQAVSQVIFSRRKKPIDLFISAVA